MNDEMEKAERLFQQLSGNETTKEDDLSHLKVCFKGSEEYCEDILEYLKGLDSRVTTNGWVGNDSDSYYFVNLSIFTINMSSEVPPGYEPLDIEDYIDIDYCPECGKRVNSSNETMYYSNGDECCESCYDGSYDDLEDSDDEECEQSYTPQVSDLESSELMYRQLSETNSNPKEIINSKLSELSSLSRRRRR